MLKNKNNYYQLEDYILMAVIFSYCLMVESINGIAVFKILHNYFSKYSYILNIFYPFIWELFERVWLSGPFKFQDEMDRTVSWTFENELDAREQSVHGFRTSSPRENFLFFLFSMWDLIGIRYSRHNCLKFLLFYQRMFLNIFQVSFNFDNPQ
ncbi:hypothetical protein RhiirA1_464425 [Rhizophagus irregularis]|uniref:Uncharacterized protein n=1 Tax=Rhizophagus irregularis TaxID=588596 RepID=A0A2N0RI39_9GLOM|nr:hypothetical protein RhiirA1_464425 [Rhizophagus irregularis]